MRIETQNISGVVLYRISGDLTFSNWEEISTDLERMYSVGEKQIILNWNRVGIIDTTGLQILVSLFKTKQKDPEFNFVLVTDNPNHLKVITICGFDKIIDIFPSEKEALEHYTGVKSV
jgi:anti-anti-sigma factor